MKEISLHKCLLSASVQKLRLLSTSCFTNCKEFTINLFGILMTYCTLEPCIGTFTTCCYRCTVCETNVCYFELYDSHRRDLLLRLALNCIIGHSQCVQTTVIFYGKKSQDSYLYVLRSRDETYCVDVSSNSQQHLHASCRN